MPDSEVYEPLLVVRKFLYSLSSIFETPAVTKYLVSPVPLNPKYCVLNSALKTAKPAVDISESAVLDYLAYITEFRSA